MLAVRLFSLTAMAFENGVSEAKIMLGQSAVFSGDSAELGIGANLGASVYFDALKTRGGNSSSIRLFGCVGNFSSVSLSHAMQLLS